jgi:phosphoglycolate phosphatase-like HAD superfamily hydrolase
MKLAVFDLDGTLTEHVDADEKCFVRAFADAYAIDQLDRHWMGYEHVTDSWVVGEVFRTKYGRTPEPAEILRYVECYSSLLAENAEKTPEPVRQVPGAQAFLSSLGEGMGWRGAIATGGWQRSARFKMVSAGITTDHLPLAFAEDGPTRESIVQSAIARAAACYGPHQFKRVVLVGDAGWDVRTARSLALPFVGVASGEDGNNLRTAGASHVIGDFLDVEQVLRCLEQATVPGV